MYRLVMAVIVAGVLGLTGYVIGSLLTSDATWSLALGAVGFGLGFALAMMLAATDRHDERPADRRRSR